MWAVAQKCCWAPAKGPHKGSQIISLQCKCDDSGSGGSLAVQPPPPPPQPPQFWCWELTRSAGCRGVSVGTVPSELKAHTHLTLGWEQKYPRTPTDPSLQVSLEPGTWPEWAGPFPHEAQTQLSTKPLFSVSRWGDWQELGEEQQQGTAEPSVTGRAPRGVAIPSVSQGSSPSRDPRQRPGHQVLHSWGTGTLRTARRGSWERGETREEGAKESRETGMEGLGRTWPTAWMENKIQWDAQIHGKQGVVMLWRAQGEFTVQLMAWCNPGYAMTEGVEWEYPCYEDNYNMDFSSDMYFAYIFLSDSHISPEFINIQLYFLQCCSSPKLWSQKIL